MTKKINFESYEDLPFPDWAKKDLANNHTHVDSISDKEAIVYLEEDVIDMLNKAFNKLEND